MKQELENNDVLDLGTASTDTKGGVFTRLDNEGSLSIPGGLTDD